MKSMAESGETGLTQRLIVNPGPAATGGKMPVAPPDAHTKAAVMRTLALDLGTQTGWALMAGQEIIESGTELLASEEELCQQRREGKECMAEIRFARFLNFVALELAAGVTRIVFEDVIFAGRPPAMAVPKNWRWPLPWHSRRNTRRMRRRAC
jgi:hypothetical protein